MMIADTNVLVRAWAGDDENQAKQARSQIVAAERVFVGNSALCEFVWVARKIYRQNRAEIVKSLRLLLADQRIVIDGPAVDAGLAFLDAGGDFADGIIEFEGHKLGGETFVTFDKRAAAVIRAKGRQAMLLDAD